MEVSVDILLDFMLHNKGFHCFQSPVRLHIRQIYLINICVRIKLAIISWIWVKVHFRYLSPVLNFSDFRQGLQ